MEKKIKKNRKRELSEYQVNTLVASKLRKQNVVVLNRVRLSPAEFDLVILDRNTLALTNIEIKKNRWERLFQQTQRGKLYCHYSIAMIPMSSRDQINIESFEQEGIGVIFYTEQKGDIDFVLELAPRKSDAINRYFKKLLYSEISNRYDSLIYA